MFALFLTGRLRHHVTQTMQPCHRQQSADLLPTTPYSEWILSARYQVLCQLPYFGPTSGKTNL
jgi:hypothetical protein